MDVHQGLHAPCVEIVDMLMPQRDDAAGFWQCDIVNAGTLRNLVPSRSSAD